MKKMVFLSIIMLLAICASAQVNRFYYGDKDEVRSNQSLARLDQQIAGYEKKIIALERANDKLLNRFRRSTDSAVTETVVKKIAVNDSLVNIYREKIDALEFAKEQAIQGDAEKGRIAYISSRGKNPEEIMAAANAYSSMVYADAYAKKMSEGSNTYTTSRMTCSVTNLYFRDVQVIVTGPNGFRAETYLEKKSGSFVMEIPGPGLYIATFLYHQTGSGMTKAVVSKEATLNPNQSSFDPKGGKHNICFTMFKGY